VASHLKVEFNEKMIDALIAPLSRCDMPGAAVGIAIGGRPVYRRAFGLANVELPVLLSTSTRMRVCSTSKHFACLAYMLLCEDGRAHIDDPLGKFLPELHPVTHNVTMRQLMGHTSGLRDAHSIRWHLNGMQRPISSAQLLSLYRGIDDVNFAPGTNYCYNNGGIHLLSAAIERISGQSLEEVLRTRIFEPVGMYDSLLRRYDDDFVANSATMHMKNADGQFCRSYLSGGLAGEGGVVATADDMLRWLAHMDRPVIGSAATWALMKTPLTLANGISTGYSLGLVSQRYRGVDVLHHGGGGLGANSQMLKVPGAGLDLAIMANSNIVNTFVLGEQILDICLPGRDPVPEPIKSAVVVTGTYRSRATGRVIQLFGREGQQIVSIDGLDLPFSAHESGSLRPMGAYNFEQITVTVPRDTQEPSAIRLTEYDNPDELTLVPAADPSDVRAIVGRWQSQATGIDAMVFQTADGLRLRTSGALGSAEFTVRSVAKGIWRASAVGIGPGGDNVLCVEGDELRLSTRRTWGLKFCRKTVR
jgi:D-aminopeptidase